MRYVENPTMLGERLRNRRLELNLLQKDVAAIVGVTEDCITLWEGGKSKPHVSYYPKLIQFLGYIPFTIDTSTLGGKIRNYRYLNGLTQEDLAKELGVNESTVFHYEKGRHKPSFNICQVMMKMMAINEFIDNVTQHHGYPLS